jgi:hypothetical protein
MAKRIPKIPQETLEQTPVLPAALDTPQFAQAWEEWQHFITVCGEKLTPADAARQLELLAKLGPEQAILDIQKAMQAHALRGQAPHPRPMASAANHTKKQAKTTKASKPTKKTKAEAAANPTAQAGPTGEANATAQATGSASGPGEAQPAAQGKKRKEAKDKKERKAATKMSALDAAAQVLAETLSP